MMALLMGVRSISPADLDKLVRERRVTVVDVNPKGSWQKGHVPGALSLNSVTYREADLPSDRKSTLVFYCSNPLCAKAPIAARRAKFMGYEDVQVMSAGIMGWKSSGLATEAG
ncbi:MAG TPA: rhodanese-like domain-containing protein [Usitatibacter sp.]|nr:rhodanese-like domain-containing protein [Usitatibacter sp.]